jgi:signal transduction histidine kinase
MGTNEQLIRAVQVATRKLASSGKFDQLLNDVLSICVEAVGASGGTIYLHDADRHVLAFRHVLPREVAKKLSSLDIPDDYGLAGQAFQKRATVTKEFPEKPISEANDFEKATGVIVRSMVATPLAMEGETPIGVVQLINKSSGHFTDADCAVLEPVAAVSTMAYLNFQLTEEVARASSLLGMGKVSHDIGNLAASLHATLSYSEPALDGLREALPKEDEELQMYAEMLKDMSTDLHRSIDRIVGYSRLISDLSAGRELRPNLHKGSLASTITTSAAYLETDGRRNHVRLNYEVQGDAPDTCFDDLYVFRIVQNLVGNAIKAVRETIPDEWLADPDNEEAFYGDVTVVYQYCDGKHRIEVKDSGPGMPPAVAQRILAGTARSQWDKGSGSGWGTKIVLELAATLHAKVEIESVLGEGTSFVVTIPHKDKLD